MSRDGTKQLALSGKWNSHLDMQKCEEEGDPLPGSEPVRLWTVSATDHQRQIVQQTDLSCQILVGSCVCERHTAGLRTGWGQLYGAKSFCSQKISTTLLVFGVQCKEKPAGDKYGFGYFSRHLNSGKGINPLLSDSRRRSDRYALEVGLPLRIAAMPP